MILELGIVAGCGVGVGAVMLVRALAPARRVDSVTAIRRLQQAGTPAPAAPTDLAGKVTSSRAIRSLAAGRWLTVPRQDLALLGTTAEQYVAYRLTTAALGLAIGPILDGLLIALGVHAPLAVPAGVALVLGITLFLTSGGDISGKASRARREARYHVLALLDITALEIAGSTAPLQAIEEGAGELDAWLVVRLRHTLTRAQLGGQAPWDALEALGKELDLTALSETAGMLRAADTEGAGAHARLTARADALRAELQSEEEANANEASERMVMPMTMLVTIFVILVVYPLATRIS
jgi:hypothetical protein